MNINQKVLCTFFQQPFMFFFLFLLWILQLSASFDLLIICERENTTWYSVQDIDMMAMVLMRIMMKLVSFVGYWRTDSLCPWWAVTWHQNTWSGNKIIIMYQCFFAWIIAGKIEVFIPRVQNHGLIQHFCLFQIRTIDRNMEIPHKGAFCDILFLLQ